MKGDVSWDQPELKVAPVQFIHDLPQIACATAN